MGIEKYIKWHHEETISQIQKVGTVIGQVMHFLQRANALKSGDGGVLLLIER